MENGNNGCQCQSIENAADILIAIGAATAANCIPCFEHLYEKAVTSGVSAHDIRRATEIAGRVKNGAHIALRHTVDELIAPVQAANEPVSEPCCR